MSLSATLVAFLEALMVQVGPALLDDLEAWVKGKRAPAPTLAQEQAAVEAAADAEAAQVLK